MAIVNGTPLNDILSGTPVFDDTLNGFAGDDLLYGDSSSGDASTGNTNDVLNGGAGDDQVFGQGGNDQLFGNGGIDILIGGDGDDILDGGAGADTVDGGVGDDLIIDRHSISDIDTYSGGVGTDTLRHDVRWSSAVTFNLLTGQQLFNGIVYDTYSGIENIEIGGSAQIIGDNNDNVLTALSGLATHANIIAGGGGNDTLNGGGGNDVLSGDTGNDNLNGDSGNDILNGGADDDSLFGGEGLDTLNGGSGNDILYGGVDSDTVNGDDGDDLIVDDEDIEVIDSYNGGGDTDTLRYDRNWTDEVTFDLATGTQSRSGITYDTFTNIENLELGGEATIIGDDNDNVLTALSSLATDGNIIKGGAGDDTIDGGGGNDVLNGGNGSDVISGGAGDDILMGGADGGSLQLGSGQITVNASTGNSSIATALDITNGFSLAADADIRSSTITPHVSIQGTGSNSAHYYAIEITRPFSFFTIDIDYGFGVGGSFDSVLRLVDASGRTIVANNNAPTIHGGGGSISRLDAYLTFQPTVASTYFIVVEENPTKLTSQLLPVDATYELQVSISGEPFIATGDDTLNGGDGNDIIDGEGGNDIVDGGAGDDLIIDTDDLDVADSYDGGADIDTLRYEGNLAAGVMINLLTGLQLFNGTIYDTYANIENLEAGGSARIVGDGNDNILTGLSATHDNIINGGGGNDTLNGGGGDDILSGSTGDDTLSGDIGDDFLNGGSGADSLFGYTGNDTLNGEAGDDNLQGGLGNDVLNGGTQNDRLFGQTGDDVLFGNAGDDVLFGQQGADQLSGGDGDDRLYADADDTLIDGGAGFDYVHAQFGESLNFDVAAANVEWVWGHFGADILDASNATTRIVLYGRGNLDILTTGSGNDTQFGGHGDDIMAGGAGDDLLYGQFHDDTINGGTGDDVLYGQQNNDILDAGAGRDFLFGGTGDDMLTGGGADLERDLFVFQTGGGTDTITDFEDGVDIIQFRAISGTPNFAALTIANNGSGDAVITYSEGTVTLTAIDQSQLDVTDFLF